MHDNSVFMSFCTDLVFAMTTKLKLALAFAVVLCTGLAASLIFAQKNPAPAVSALTLEGKVLNLSDLRGQVVLVNFWATSCTTCVKEMPEIAATQRKFEGQGYQTLAIAMQYDNPGFVAAFALKNGLPFTVAYDKDGSAARGFGDVRLTPVSFLIDRHGMIVKRILGAPDFPALHREIEALLKG